MLVIYLKGFCIRYRNFIEIEIKKVDKFVLIDVLEEDLIVLFRNVEILVRWIKEFSVKFEEMMEKWLMVIEG